MNVFHTLRQFKQLQFQVKVHQRTLTPIHPLTLLLAHCDSFIVFRAGGTSSGQASCLSAWSSNNRSAALRTAAATDGQFEHPAGGQRKVALVLSDKPLLVLKPNYGDKVNHRVMGSSWTTASMYRKRNFCSLGNCYESLDHGCFQILY